MCIICILQITTWSMYHTWCASCVSYRSSRGVCIIPGVHHMYPAHHDVEMRTYHADRIRSEYMYLVYIMHMLQIITWRRVYVTQIAPDQSTTCTYPDPDTPMTTLPHPVGRYCGNGISGWWKLATCTDDKNP